MEAFHFLGSLDVLLLMGFIFPTAPCTQHDLYFISTLRWNQSNDNLQWPHDVGRCDVDWTVICILLL